ncbi:hypothetical protein RRG55_04320 [Mycoplasmopsis felis]|uniref:hypothetical protein n=1 Tax=Mycoplasmopsis felis TaxID=33923 RepID=UPI002AFEAEC5|nr:hypothetical protein [Mycoplasmopsis felis]WQQ04273.1 hypothetical protein RRG47_01740 [Mycoplasmopsis felis]
MLKAKENLKHIIIPKDELNKNYVYQSDKFLLKKDKKISIALSWLFNSGLLKETEIIKEKVNIGLHLTGRFPIYEANYKMHKNEKELLKYETFRRQENRFFSDYDLYLKKENSDGNWENIKVSNSITSNDELIRYVDENEGMYGIAIYKYNDSYKNSILDDLAISLSQPEEIF